jgi:hypothetical protein
MEAKKIRGTIKTKVIKNLQYQRVDSGRLPWAGKLLQVLNEDGRL